MSGGDIHISSFVVRARPEAVDAVSRRLAGWDGVEIHATAAGKIVATLECASENRIVETLDRIQRLDGVMAANLVFHHAEPARDLEGPPL